MPASPPALPPDSAYTRFYCEENVFLLARALHPRRAWDVFAVFLSNPPRSVALWSQAASPRADGRVVWDYHVVLALRPRDAPTSIDSDSEAQWQSEYSESDAASAEPDGLPSDDDDVTHPIRTRTPPRIGPIAHPNTIPISHTSPIPRPPPADLDFHSEDDAEAGAGAGVWIYDFDTRLGVPCRWPEYVAGTLAPARALPPEYHSLFRIVPAAVYLDNFASDRAHMGADVARPPWAPLRGPRAAVPSNLMDAFVDMRARGFGAVVDLAGFVAWCAGAG